MYIPLNSYAYIHWILDFNKYILLLSVSVCFVCFMFDCVGELFVEYSSVVSTCFVHCSAPHRIFCLTEALIPLHSVLSCVC